MNRRTSKWISPESPANHSRNQETRAVVSQRDVVRGRHKSGVCDRKQYCKLECLKVWIMVNDSDKERGTPRECGAGEHAVDGKGRLKGYAVKITDCANTGVNRKGIMDDHSRCIGSAI